VHRTECEHPDPAESVYVCSMHRVLRISIIPAVRTSQLDGRAVLSLPILPAAEARRGAEHQIPIGNRSLPLSSKPDPPVHCSISQPDQPARQAPVARIEPQPPSAQSAPIHPPPAALYSIREPGQLPRPKASLRQPSPPPVPFSPSLALTLSPTPHSPPPPNPLRKTSKNGHPYSPPPQL